MTDSKGGLKNYTTSISPDKTATEIIGLLALHGASRIQLLTDGHGAITGIIFGLVRGDTDLGFRLPIQVESTYIKMCDDSRGGKIPPRFANKEQAERTAWRIMKDWVDAQIALIDTGMVRTEEVFLPYLLTTPGRTLFEEMEQRWLALPEPQAD